MKKNKSKICIIELVILLIIFIVFIYSRIAIIEKNKVQNIFNKLNLEKNYNKLNSSKINYNFNNIVNQHK